MKSCATIAILAITATARAQFFTPAEVQWLDFRYGGSSLGGSGLTTNTDFGQNVTGKWNTLDVKLSVLGPRLAGTGLTARASGILDVTSMGLTTDNTTTTNDGTRISVKGYDTNAIARTIYLRNARDTLWDYQYGHINAATLAEMTNGGPMAQTLAQLVGP